MNNTFISRVFRYLGLGTLITFLVAYIVSISEPLIRFVYQGSTLIILCILEIVIAICLSGRINKMKKTTATILYFAYTALTGLTLSSIFIAYELTSIIYIFLATTIIFLIFSFIGRNLKIDLSKFGTFLFIALLSVLVLEIINIFILNSTLDMWLCIISLLIFIAYIAYDIQKVIKLSSYTNSDNIAIIGAFTLYLDIINIFIRLIRLFGKEK